MLHSVEQAAAEAGKHRLSRCCIKARAGGGGRGIRLVDSPEELEDAFLAAAAEAPERLRRRRAVSWKNTCYPVKHIEVQILVRRSTATSSASASATAPCSATIRSCIEESPSPAVTADMRQQMIDAAAQGARRQWAMWASGTMEFLLTAATQFYFMEMNTRLQVEHPVTEMVTGIDLVKWQIRVAAGDALRLRAGGHARCAGHAIECRINAENPRRNFRAVGCGTDHAAAYARAGRGCALTRRVYQDYTVPPFYDSHDRQADRVRPRHARKPSAR